MSFFLYTVTFCLLWTIWPELCTMFLAKVRASSPLFAPVCAGFLSSPLVTLPLALQKQHFSFSRSFMLSLSFFVGTKDISFHLCLVREFLFRCTKVYKIINFCYDCMESWPLLLFHIIPTFTLVQPMDCHLSLSN